ncbi:MAG TPA: ribonuclease HI [Planctomycetaceae bacterium]|nr:ribonuclease HI [Planctomycetaceae bacterium]
MSSPRFEPEVVLYTDGACSGNPGPGGWGFILRHPHSGKELVRSGGDENTTNNRMEMTAVIEGLKALTRPTRVELVSDSKYVLQGLSEWMPNWKKNNWRRKENGRWKPVKNVELWQALDDLIAKHEFRFTHIRGHAGHPENERCDRLAVEASVVARRGSR